MLNAGQGQSSLARLLRRWRSRARDEAGIDRRYAAWLDRQPRPDGTPPTGAPLIAIVMPVCDPRPEWLEQAIESVRAQTHSRWELLIADDASSSPAITAILARAADDDPRVTLTRLPRRLGISRASNAAMAQASADWVMFLDHDDILAPHALTAIARVLVAHPQSWLVFSDEDQLVGGRRVRPYFKPGWNPDLLLSQNFVCHLAVFRRSVLRDQGGLRPALDGSQDHDLVLRAALEAPPDAIRHIPEILYHWRQSPGSFSASAASRCAEATRRAVASAAGARCTILPDAVLPQWPIVRFEPPSPEPSHAVLRGPAQAQGVQAEMLLFLSANLEPPDKDWWRPLAGQLYRDGVGAVGARLEDGAGRVVQGGLMLDAERIAVPLRSGPDPTDPGYRGFFHLPRTVSAVSADVLAIRRDVLAAAGGFEPNAGDFASVDLCLRLALRGLRTVWTPHARLRYRTPPAPMRQGARWMRARWGAALARDPYLNPNLTLRGGRLALAPPFRKIP